MTANLTEPSGRRILQALPFEKGFHFTKADGSYTGKTAAGLFEFEDKLETINLESIEFHFKRQDFQKWIKDIFGNEELAWRINKIKFNLSGEPLRKALLKTVNKQLFSELKKIELIAYTWAECDCPRKKDRCDSKLAKKEATYGISEIPKRLVNLDLVENLSENL